MEMASERFAVEVRIAKRRRGNRRIAGVNARKRAKDGSIPRIHPRCGGIREYRVVRPLDIDLRFGDIFRHHEAIRKAYPPRTCGMIISAIQHGAVLDGLHTTPIVEHLRRSASRQKLVFIPKSAVLDDKRNIASCVATILFDYAVVPVARSSRRTTLAIVDHRARVAGYVAAPDDRTPDSCVMPNIVGYDAVFDRRPAPYHRIECRTRADYNRICRPAR